VSEQSQVTEESHSTSGEAPVARERRRRSRPETRWNFIIAIAVIAGVAAAFSSASPTGVGVFDVIERAGFAVVVTLLAACCRRWAWLILAGFATVLAATIWGHVLGAVALGFAVHAAARTDTRDRITGALIGALSAQALLRTDDIGFFGSTAILTAVAVAPVMVSGYRTMRRRNRRRVRIGLTALGFFVLVAVGGFAYSAARASEPLQYGVTSARRGLDVANSAGQIGAAGYWTAAHNSFSKADDILSSPIAKLAYVVPVLSQHARLASVAADSGSSITGTAARAATIAPYQRLRAADGTFDLERISSMEKPIRQTARAMVAARDDVDDEMSSWLVDPFRTRVDDYRAELVRAIPQAETALQAIEIAPEVLGGNGERHYLLLFANPAETRGLGGFIGAWAQLDANDGHLELVRHGKMGELNDATDPASRKITGEPEYLRRYGHLQPARFLQNISASPDFPTVARVAEQLYPQTGGVDLDGVMYVDPTALAALLKLTGPILAEGVPKALTSKNAARFLMHDQYVEVPGIDDRTDLLSNAAEATFDALTHRELPPVSTITHTLSPMMHGRNIMVMLNDAEANRYLSKIGLTGAFPKPGRGDLVSVRISNGSENKADYYVNQFLAYQIRHSFSTGRSTGTIGALISNDAPASGLPPYVLGNQDTRAGRTDGRPFGSTTLQVSIYSALRPVSMRIGDRDVGVQVQRELGSWVATQTVTIPPGGSVKILLRVEGVLPRANPYALSLVTQPTANRPTIGAVLQATDARGKPLPLPPEKLVDAENALARFVRHAPRTPKG
jgi:hypothetical protein